MHDEYVCAAHILQNLEINLTVAESPQQRFAQRHVQVAADTLRQYRIRGPGENLESVVVHDARAPCGHSPATSPCMLTNRRIFQTRWTPRDAEAESTTRSETTRRCASNERTSRARQSRKRRSDRAETQQRLGAPSLGSGKLQTPPNRYPPARLLQLLFGATPA